MPQRESPCETVEYNGSGTAMGVVKVSVRPVVSSEDAPGRRSALKLTRLLIGFASSASALCWLLARVSPWLLAR